MKRGLQVVRDCEDPGLTAMIHPAKSGQIRVDLIDDLENFGIYPLAESGRQLNFPDAGWKDD